MDLDDLIYELMTDIDGFKVQIEKIRTSKDSDHQKELRVNALIFACIHNLSIAQFEYQIGQYNGFETRRD